ncbi:hypothetical protein [Bosea sp. (in: a-proteobacteria)]|uniref:hypothetical protein n=1 Tax=Bosea sp. (in: a-proteobacteria) TaxID=1871050 RepID=UPI00121F3810|nr:hypothetical protein [Bosea sp. (in: a-proteobacteria)]TAJ29950.1 MAG: hypothetical protein EPO59_13470 [Bosea sp. (in: a-proteobacteria)]
MKRSQAIRLTAAGALAAVTFTLALLHLIALAMGGELKVGGLRLAVVASGYDRRAEQQVATRNPDLANLAEAERLSRLAIAQFPYDTSAWLRIAYIDGIRNLGLSKAGVAALSRSYDLVAVDPLLAPWRIHFALENWGNLPAALRISAESEARSLSADGGGRSKLQAALAAVSNPETTPVAQKWLERYVISPSRVEQAAHENAAKHDGLLKN